MSYTPIIITLALLLLGSALGWADDYYGHSALPVRGDERAVLVLCPGMNANGNFFLEESSWTDFAIQNRLGIIAIHYKSDPDSMYGKTRSGYYWPEQGSGGALLAEIERIYGESLPILIYGFSGGAQFASRFVEWVPERIIAWTAYSAQFWGSPSAAKFSPPGIIACGEYDGARWIPSFNYFYEGRSLGKPWLWISIRGTGHFRHAAFERFVRDFFAEVLEQNNELTGEAYSYVDVGTSELLPSADVFGQPSLVSLFPSESLFEQWKQIHSP